MPTDTEISNLSLSHIGIGVEIAALETESSEEAGACRRYFTQARNEVLRAFPWSFATQIIAIALIETDPNTEWGYSYRYPTDCIFFRRIQSGNRNDSRQSRIAYKIAQDSNARLIYTDQADAVGEYTISVTDTKYFPPDFVSALSLLLASYIAPRLTSGDPFKMGELAMKRYIVQKSIAQGNSANEEQPDEIVEGEFITGRD